MSDQKYLDFLKVLESELLSFRWGCVFNPKEKTSLAEFGNLPFEMGTTVPERYNAVFEEASKTTKGCIEVFLQDDQWIVLMRRFSKSPLLCCILFHNSGITTAWARNTLKQKMEEFVVA